MLLHRVKKYFKKYATYNVLKFKKPEKALISKQVGSSTMAQEDPIKSENARACTIASMIIQHMRMRTGTKEI